MKGPHSGVSLVVSLPDIRRFNAFWNEDANGCYVWSGFTQPSGYGMFSLNGMPRLAHRVAYTINWGNIPSGLTLDHLCRNKSCVNAEHLEPVSMRINSERVPPKQRVTHCPRGHVYNKANTYVRLDNGAYVCKTCRREVWGT